VASEYADMLKYSKNKERSNEMGGFISCNNSSIICHTSSPDVLTKESIEYLEKEYGMVLRCSICGNQLKPGDRKDHYWPYFDDMNRCNRCLENEKK